MLFGSMLWGLTWIPLKYFHQQGMDVIPLVLMTNGVVALLLLPILIKQFPLWRNDHKYIWIILIASSIANLAFATAMIYGDVIRAMVLFYLLPAWGVLGGKFFLNEKIDRTRLFAVLLALLGAFLVLDGYNFFKTSASWIDFFALLAGFALAVNNIAFRASVNLPVASKISAVFLGSTILAIILLVFGVQPFPDINISDWLPVFAFGLFWILLATLCTQWAVTRLEVGQSSILIIMELVTAVVSAMWIGGERASLLETIGGLLILTAAYFEARRRVLS